MVEKYIAVMNIRFGGKFMAEYDVDDKLVEYLIPGLMIQPIVENALIHGLQGKDDKALVHICGYVDDNAVYIEIFDNGIGFSPDKLTELQSILEICEAGDYLEPGLSGVALTNIQRRILSWFGNGFGLSVDSVPQEGTTVIIRLPAIRDAQYG
jgi:two-component system sensor histidine kinase YesM